MTLDREVAPDADVPMNDEASASSGTQRVSRATVVWYSTLTVLLVGWFFFAWLVLGLNPVDAAGESLGTAFALLLIVSVIGTVRGSRR